ncbi:MAG TPA: HAD family hydrolase [Terriglobales bacterium]|nr:HAD family hydrolase [Terriglobales bacterium]
MSDVVSTEIVALIFDFDDTLAPDSTTKLLKNGGIDTNKFWQNARTLVEQGYDQPSAYLKLILDNVGEGKALGGLTNARLRDFGASLDRDFYPGLPGFFDEIRDDVRSNYRNIQIEFYIVSGGLYEVVAGSAIVRKYFKAIYGCHLAGDKEEGILKFVKRSITFTEKTRFIYEIHKGLDPRETARNPALVNKFIPQEQRRIPLSNMIYVGDGLTDIPCFSLLKSTGGLGFGVFDPKQEKKAKTALEEFLQTDRVISMHAPNYEKGADLGAILRAAVANRCTAIQLHREQPRREPKR